MSGCSNCGAKGGCDHRKSAMFEAALEVLHRAYPTRVWPELVHEGVAALPRGELFELADILSVALKGSVVVQEGGDSDLCDFLYILCQGREPSLMQVLRDDVPLPEELASAKERTSELYLRVAVSHLGRLAIVQEVQLELAPAEGGDGHLVTSRSLAGVYSAPLLKRFRKLVSILKEFDLQHCDMGELCEPPQGFDGKAFLERYGREASYVGYLFFHAPLAEVVESLLDQP